MRKRSSPPRKKWAGILLAGALVMLLLIMISVLALPQIVASYIISDKARPLAEQALTEQLGMTTSFAPFSKNGEKLHSSKLFAHGDSSLLEAYELRARAWIDGWFAGVLKIDSFEIREARLTLDAPQAEQQAPAVAATMTESDVPGWLALFLPHRIEFSPLTVGKWRIETGRGLGLSLRNVNITKHQQEIALATRTGTLTSEEYGSWAIKNFESRIVGDELRIVDAQLNRLESRASSSFSGTINRSGQTDIELEFDNMPLDVVAPTLSSNMDGRMRGWTKLQRVGASEQLAIDGNLEVEGGRVHGLKMLDLVARYTGDRSLSNLPLHNAEAEIIANQGQSKYRKIHLESNGKLKLLGELTVGNDGSLLGDLQLGVAAHLIRTLPVDRDAIFELAEDGYYWTPVLLSGTVEQPVEDLSTRLAASMPTAVLKKTTEVLRSTGKNMGTAPATAADAAADIVEQAGDRFLDMLLPSERSDE